MSRPRRIRPRSSGSDRYWRNELGLEDATEVAVGTVEPIFGAEGHQTFECYRRRNMTRLKRGVELSHAVPLLGDQLGIDCPVGTPYQGCERAVVTVGIEPLDALVLNATDARAEAQLHHSEGREVDFGVAVRVGVMLFDLELALVV